MNLSARLSSRMLEGFCSRFVVEPTGCWIYQGTLSGDGYGVLHFGAHGEESRTSTTAIRVAYELWRGPIPEGFEPDHICSCRPCICPDHLELVTRSENMLRARERNRMALVCWRGHFLTPKNTRIQSGWRVCRTCRPEVVRRAA